MPSRSKSKEEKSVKPIVSETMKETKKSEFSLSASKKALDPNLASLFSTSV